MAPLATYLPNLGDYAKPAVFAGILAIVVILYQTFFATRYYANLPLVGEPAGRRWFSLRTRWRYYTDCASLYNEAYQNVGVQELITRKQTTLLNY
jgi:hypothetical protein